MAGIDETIVREYFELNGFLVRQMRKYQVQSRAKRSEEEIDLIVINPGYREQTRRPNFMLFSNELPLIQRAVVFVKGWHSQKFTPATLRGSADIFKFLEKDVYKRAEELFAIEKDQIGEIDNFIKILVLPGLPTHEPHKSESIKLLQDVGLDAIISFRSMLQDIMSKVEINHNYSKDDFLQTLRILKNYDMVKSPQMDLFNKS
ncbi:hypothetical protein [Cerasicoccus arenae]|uniref:Uncharacterized protein n=1 Tax=Cerasicoccus arenae TaxID=424488 RepID=A0A8J3D8X2_9BACT|nr:hypothetical protein [Cerasicoccus arenae]MBK1856876.1 hypothetical protein [Cerasicoccus arenae]GHB89610.1 hypothetical protein GCM10007047_00010 [Cerasicoccus arenae]